MVIRSDRQTPGVDTRWRHDAGRAATQK